jgi:oligogalacturonide lyase
MSKGDVLPSEKREFTQPETGVRVIQLTDAPCRNTNAYYNDEQFTADGDTFVFRSDRTGERQLFAVDTDSGRIVQLTEASGDGVGGWSVHAASRRVFFGDGQGNLARLDLDSLTVAIVAEPLDGCTGLNGLDLSSCGRFAAVSTRPDDARLSRWPGHHFRHGTETMALVCDFEKGTKAIVYHGPTPEVGGTRQSPDAEP